MKRREFIKKTGIACAGLSMLPVTGYANPKKLLLIGDQPNVAAAKNFYLEDFGGKADGITDDGPAILLMIEAARAMKGKPVRLVFPNNKVIFAATGKDRYLFPLQHTKNITVEGNGSTFLLDPQIRMMDLDYAKTPLIRNVKVDYTVTMFIESVIEAVDAKGHYVDVKVLNSGDEQNLGGPSQQDGEQWFGGFVWCENAKHPKAARHYAVKGVKVLGDDRARVFFDGQVIVKKITGAIKLGTTQFSIPRPGVAHRYGPGALFNIHDTVDGHFENITVWAAPWFTFSIYRTEGTCRFINVNVMPKPGTNRLMAGCRDAFHVTGNRAKLIFDSCDTAGLGDDDYNFCILSSQIHKVVNPTEIVIRQKFPIQYNPMRVGETLMVMNSENQMVGSARITAYKEQPNKDGSAIMPGQRTCPPITITLDKPIKGLTKDLHVWSKEAANPDTTMKHCTASFSIRMQTSLTIDRCTFTCYNTAYGFSSRTKNVEGPGPAFMRITNSEFHVGRSSGLVFKSAGKGPLESTRISNIHLENNTFHGPLNIDKAKDINLLNNKFYGNVKVDKYTTLQMRGNQHNGKPFTLPGAHQRMG